MNFDSTKEYNGGMSLFGTHWNPETIKQAVIQVRNSIREFVPKEFLKHVLFSKGRDEDEKLMNHQVKLVFWSYRPNGHDGVKTDHLTILEV